MSLTEKQIQAYQRLLVRKDKDELLDNQANLELVIVNTEVQMGKDKAVLELIKTELEKRP